LAKRVLLSLHICLNFLERIPPSHHRCFPTTLRRALIPIERNGGRREALRRSRHPESVKASSSPLQGYNDDGIDDDDIGSGGDIDDDDIGNGSFKNGDNISGKSADDLGGKDGVCQRGQGRHQAARTTAAAAIQ